MQRFIGLVHKDPESAYGVTFPDLPGCFSAADTEADLIANAVDAIGLYFDEDEAAPDQRSVDELRLDPEIAADLRNGAFLISVPFIRFDGKSQPINFTVDKGLRQAMDAAAKERGLTRSAFLAAAIQAAIEQ